MIKKVKAVVLEQLTQGVTPHGLALSCSFAVALGTFPTLGATTILLFIFGAIFKLNQPITQALNYILTPVHVLMIPVFLRIGEWLVGATPVTIHPQELVSLFFADWRLFMVKYGMAAVYAIFAWALIMPALGTALYFLIKPLFKKIK